VVREIASAPPSFTQSLSVWTTRAREEKLQSPIRLDFGVDVVWGVVGPPPRIGPAVIEKVAIYLLSFFFGDESREYIFANLLFLVGGTDFLKLRSTVNGFQPSHERMIPLFGFDVLSIVLEK
jgi:hypothetical protein